MEDADGGFSFDFEGGLDAVGAASAAPQAVPATGGQLISTVAAAGVGAPNGVAAPSGASQVGRRNYRQTVCRHWLRSLCMKGDACGFLHQLDRSRMPICRFFSKYGECHEPDCIYKHTFEDVKECNMYKMGFCPNGPDCRYKHVKMPGPFPPLEESLQKIHVRLISSSGRPYARNVAQSQGYTSYQEVAQVQPPPRQPVGEEAQASQSLPQLPVKEVQQQQPLQDSQFPPPPPPPPLPPPPPSVPSMHVLPTQRVSGFDQQQQGPAIQPSWQQTLDNGSGAGQGFVSLSIPLPQGFSSNRENLELSVARGLWATHRNNEAKLNEAFDSTENVILIFSVNETGHFQGCARMMSKIGVIVGGGGWKYAHGTAHYGRNFRLKWLKLCELSFNKTRHLRNPYKENLPVKISRDCQELEPTVGEQLASLLYMEPDSELMKVAIETQLKWENERARAGQEPEENNTVPFEVVEEDQDEEESEEDDSGNQISVQGKRPPTISKGPGDVSDLSRSKARGRGRDNFTGGYERLPGGLSNGFKMHGTAPGRGFPAYPLPRYGSPMGFGRMDGAVLAPGMLLSGRPSPGGIFVHGGPGMIAPPSMVGVRPGSIMGAPRPPFIPGPGQHGRSSGMPFRPPQSGSWGRREQGSRRQKSESTTTGNRLPSGGEHRSGEKPHERLSSSEEAYGIGNIETQQLQEQDYAGESYAKDDDSLSEDEAPRRSRHGEGKRRRRAT
ncbi:hypothetical protein KP509_29G075600 [Ceratopteris richardii]|uniref:30-kDa cleavage and polyadenylation specificity factor 30 n=1 Tax=Ceratopteris richardii TaxID=49495 RepID=A0A8T2R898_CERRI|nr:hypothetical protein KP509_29G075600 [Ceratopteris richardii]